MVSLPLETIARSKMRSMLPVKTRQASSSWGRIVHYPMMLIGRISRLQSQLRMRFNEDGSRISSCDEFVRYVGGETSYPCGLAFGPGGLYFIDQGTDRRNTGSVFRVSPLPGYDMRPYARAAASLAECVAPLQGRLDF